MRFHRLKSTRKARFKHPPGEREIGSSVGQGPDGVKMVRQHDDGLDGKWMPAARVAERRAEQINVVREQPKPAVCEVHSEEIAAARDEAAAVVRHRLGASGDWFRFAQTILPKGRTVLLSRVSDP